VREVALLLWLGYITIATVVSWFTRVETFADFLISILVWLFLNAIALGIAYGKS